MKKNRVIRIILIISLFMAVLSATPARAQALLTDQEQAYINNADVIKAVSLNGAAPLQYVDSKGQIKGISKEVLEEISRMTGLTFEYQMYDTLNEALEADADILFGIPYNYAPEDIVMSTPFLKSETILYINSSVNPNELHNKRYAAVIGSDLPEGILEENSIYFDTREASLEAVDRGKADFGYGNAFSVSFYVLQNSYKNIIIVPDVKESREYCFGLLKSNDTLLSIINKSISSIEESHIRTLILNATTQIERKITVPMVIGAYGSQILGVFSLVISVLSLSIVLNIRAKNQLKIQNERYQRLSQTSNEYLYEYHVKAKHLELSKSCTKLFGNSENLSELKAIFNKETSYVEKNMPIIELPISGGEKILFKSVNSPIYDDKGKLYSIIGKLIDVSQEEAEKQELIKRSETDGLTGLYNAVTTRNIINESMQGERSSEKDALIVIDCDKFKQINDTYGHLEGDKVLVNISRALTQTFRKTDIIGRIGGEEFCVYMLNTPSTDFIVSKCEELMELISDLSEEILVTVSIGISLLGGENSYDDIFKKADHALYKAKNNGRAQIQFFN